MGNVQRKINKVPSSNNAFFICEICTEQVPSHRKFKNKKRSLFAFSSSQPCAHPFCTDCIAKYILVKIGENEKPDIKCPDTNCANVLDPLSCRSFLPPLEFVRWCDYLCQSTVRQRYDTGYCPNPFCSEFIFSECRRSFWRRWISECPHCKMMFCLRCMVLCQDNHQCTISGSASRQAKRANEVSFLFIQTAVSKYWKRCPSCRFYVEKSDGCSHITCRCGSRFCYSCGDKLNKRQRHICKTLGSTPRL